MFARIARSKSCRALSDRIVLMQKGKVIANGKPQDVLTQQALTMLYGADITVLKDPANHSPLIVLDH